MWLGCGSSKSVKSSPGVAKAQPLYLGAKLNLGDRVWGEVEKNSFIALPGKGGHSRLMPSRLYVPHWRGLGGIINRFKKCDQIMDVLLIGWWGGDWK